MEEESIKASTTFHRNEDGNEAGGENRDGEELISSFSSDKERKEEERGDEIF